MSKQRDSGEALLQVAFINWMRTALPDVLVWHVYNETGRNSRDANSEKWAAIQGKIRKDRGVLAGVHDNHLVWAPGCFATIELKSPNKAASQSKYSDKQQAFAERLDKVGFKHACCQSGEQIEATLRGWGLLPRYSFPRSLAATGSQMFRQLVADELWRRD